MIILNHNNKSLDSASKIFQLRGFCISELELNGDIKIIFQKGIGITLTKKILELYNARIIENRQGYIKDNIGTLTVYLHYFKKSKGNKLVIIYIDKAENLMNYSELYHLSKKIFKDIISETGNSKIEEIFNRVIEIPKAKGLLGIFIIDKAGFLFFSKVAKNRESITNNLFQIAGFFSAIMICSQDFLGSNEYGLKLEDIDLGNQHFYVKTKNDVIFAYLIEKTNCSENTKRYLMLIMEEFLEKHYNSHVKNFKGDLTPFNSFNNVIDQYFEI